MNQPSDNSVVVPGLRHIFACSVRQALNLPLQPEERRHILFGQIDGMEISTHSYRGAECVKYYKSP